MSSPAHLPLKNRIAPARRSSYMAVQALVGQAGKQADRQAGRLDRLANTRARARAHTPKPFPFSYALFSRTFGALPAPHLHRNRLQRMLLPFHGVHEFQHLFFCHSFGEEVFVQHVQDIFPLGFESARPFGVQVRAKAAITQFASVFKTVARKQLFQADLEDLAREVD